MTCVAAGPLRAQSLLDAFTSSSDNKKKQPAPAPAAQKGKTKPAEAAAANTPAAKPPAAKTATPARAQPRVKANDNVIVIMGSGQMTGFTQIAGDITNLIEGIPQKQLRVIPMIGKSSEQNLRDMVSLNGMDFAVISADTLDLLKIKDPKAYAAISKNVRYVAKLFPIELHIYAGPDIKNLEDLRGKTISCQASSAATMCEHLFKSMKIDVRIVYEEEAAGRQKLRKGEVAAVAFGATPPFPALEKAGPEENLHLVPISEDGLPDFALLLQRYQQAKLRHQDYPNLIPPGEYVPTIAVEAVLVVHAWPANNPRHQLKQKFVGMLFDHFDALRLPARHPRWRDVNISTDLQGWTRFRPAQDWLDSKRNAQGGGIMASAIVDDDPIVKAAFDKFMSDYSKATGKPVDEKQKDELYPRFIEWWQKKNGK